MNQIKYLQLSFALLALCISLGAFATHALEKDLASKYLNTFNVGVKYLTYHSIILLIISSNIEMLRKLIWTKRFYSLWHITIFRNCIIYALTQIKAFAMIVPIGGMSFILAWIIAIIEIKKD